MDALFKNIHLLNLESIFFQAWRRGIVSSRPPTKLKIPGSNPARGKVYKNLYVAVLLS
jgi:hypothetical protein